MRAPPTFPSRSPLPMLALRTPCSLVALLLGVLLSAPVSCADADDPPGFSGDTVAGPTAGSSPNASVSGSGACADGTSADCLVGSVAWPTPPLPDTSEAHSSGEGQGSRDPDPASSDTSGANGSGSTGASGTGSTGSGHDAATPLRIRGSLTYDDRVYDTGGFTGEIAILPVQDTVVELVREADGAVVANALTDADGEFVLRLTETDGGPHHVRALAAGRVGGLTTVVRDRTVQAAVYALRSAAFEPSSAPQRIALHAAVDQPIGGAMNITDVATEGFRFILPWLDADASAPLTWRWQPGRSFPCGSCYRNNVVSLGGQLEDPDEYDDDIILHELGHWFVDHFSADTSPGGPHRDRLVSPQLAYGEGLAYFFVGLVRDTPHIVDNFLGSRRWIDMENLEQNGVPQANMKGTHDGTVDGDHREELVSGVLWHAYRAPDGTHAFDRVHLGIEGHMRLLVEVFGQGAHPDVGARGIDLADWLLAAACHLGVPAADLQALADAHDYPFAIADALTRCGEVRGPDAGRKDTRHRRIPRPSEAPDAGSPPCALKADRFLPLPVEHRAGRAMLVDGDGVALPVTLEVEVRGAHATQAVRVHCAALPCTLAEGIDDATSVVVTGTTGGRWSAGSWSGPVALDRMLGTGEVVLSPTWGALRVYPSAQGTERPESPGR